MKIRNGFISNSSSSSFVLPNDVDKDEVLNFCKEKVTEVFEEHIEEIKRLKSKYCSNWKQLITLYKKDIKNLNKNIDILPYKSIDWDLSEYFDTTKLNPDTLILFDNDDNVLNTIKDDIIEKYKVKNWVCHI